MSDLKPEPSRLPIRIIGDVHAATSALAVQAARPGPLVVVGDFLNFVDYRTLDGILTDVCGRGFVAELVRLRTAGDIARAREHWRHFARDGEDELRDRIDASVDRQYAAIGAALAGADAYVTYGNIDRPAVLRRYLPPSTRFLDGDRVEIGGRLIGLVGGGLALDGGVPMPGEVTEEELADKLTRLGDVDVLCTHVPPAVPALQRDVIAGRQKGSLAVLEYLCDRQPAFHYFGDIHQPQATRWRVGATTCVNVGYFRATGRPVVHR